VWLENPFNAFEKPEKTPLNVYQTLGKQKKNGEWFFLNLSPPAHCNGQSVQCDRCSHRVPLQECFQVKFPTFSAKTRRRKESTYNMAIQSRSKGFLCISHLRACTLMRVCTLCTIL